MIAGAAGGAAAVLAGHHHDLATLQKGHTSSGHPLIFRIEVTDNFLEKRKTETTKKSLR
jgi:hypothetical protein